MTRYYLEKVSPQNCLGKQETRERRHRKATEFIENRVKVHQHAWEDATKKKKKTQKDSCDGMSGSLPTHPL